MPLLQRGVAAATNRMPNVISPTAHAIIDYITVGAFFLMAAAFWRRNKRAALGSLMCGSAELGTALMTDFPGGLAKVIDLPTHLRIDMGLAAMAATLPDLMGFKNEPESKWLRVLGLGYHRQCGADESGRTKIGSEGEAGGVISSRPLLREDRTPRMRPTRCSVRAGHRFDSVIKCVTPHTQYR